MKRFPSLAACCATSTGGTLGYAIDALLYVTEPNKFLPKSRSYFQNKSVYSISIVFLSDLIKFIWFISL